MINSVTTEILEDSFLKRGLAHFVKESSQKGAFDIYSVPKKNLLFDEFSYVSFCTVFYFKYVSSGSEVAI